MRGAFLGLVLACLVAAPASAAEEQLPPFPNFTLRSLDGGSSMTVASLRGKPVLLTFWASWCGPCRLELPELQKLHEELKARGFALVTVNMDSSTAAARRFLELNKLKIPVYRMEQRDLRGLGVTSLPTSILLAPDGRPVRLYEGYTPGEAGALRELVLGLLDSGRKTGA